MNKLDVLCTVRNYQDSDADIIGCFDNVLRLTYRYHRDYTPENILCGLDAEDRLLGVGHLSYHETWHLIEDCCKPPDHSYKLCVNISLSPDAPKPNEFKAILLQALITRAKEIKANSVSRFDMVVNRQQVDAKKVDWHMWFLTQVFIDLI